MAFADIGELETLQCRFAKGVATIALNRPDSLNAITAEVHRDLNAALDVLEADSTVRCLLLTGMGRGFCSGQDLTEKIASGPDGRPDLATLVVEKFNPLTARLDELPVPTVAAVNGIAAGAGASLALICDIVLAAESASFVKAFCRIALVPDSGGTWVLPRLVGRQRALAMMMTGEEIDAMTARDWGMVWAVYPDATFAADAHDFAARLAAGPTATYAHIKHATRKAWDNDLGAQLQLEAELQAECGRLDDFAEGIAAFAAKRAPVFRGK